MSVTINILKAGMLERGVSLSESQLHLFSVYLNNIQAWNKKVNITAIQDEKEIIIKHFLDSLTALNYISDLDKTFLDMGTGAGLPGLPLKILIPSIEMVFVDSSTKKINVVKDICQKLKVNNYSVVSQNVERLGRETQYRGRFDVVLSRALAPLVVLLEYGLPLLKVGGKMIVYKGPAVDEEVENSAHALSILKGRIKEKAYFYLPLSDFKRSILVVEKLGITPDKYPRNVGIPRKRPLQ